MKSPLTGRSDTELVYTVNPTQIADQWQRSMGVDVGQVFRNLTEISYWRCKTTGLRWYSPPEAAGEGALYSQLEKFDWYYMPEKWEFDVALQLLGASDRILEVGVGEGHFLHSAKVRGYQTQGIELNPTAAERVKKKGFEVHQISLEEMKNRGVEPFDAICSFQVLEHVPDPRAFIEGMLGVLRKGGKLILSVPNAAVMRRVDPANKDLLNQPPHHISHWDVEVFHSIEKILPLRIYSVHREPLASYHVTWLVNGYLRSLLSPFGNVVPRLLVNRYTTLPIKWIMLAGARKWFPGHTLLVEFEYLP